VRIFALLACVAVAVMLGGCAQRPVHSRQLPAKARPAQSAAQPIPISPNVGKDLFLARCGSCHDERGDKPLRSGPPLNQRKLSREVIAEAVNDRLKSRTEAEREAVIEYISGLYVGPK
jgi:mono/diheme cytochrome c family protein